MFEEIRSFLYNAYFIQIIGFVGLVVSLLVFQCKKYNSMMFTRIASEIIFAFQYFLLGSYTGTSTNLISVITNYIYTDRVKKRKPTLWCQIIFSVIFTVVGIMTWHGWLSVIVIIAKLLSTISYGSQSPKFIRYASAITHPLWLIHDIVAGSIGGIITNSIGFFSLLIGIYRFDIKKEKEVQ